jgi:serine/threonine protein kinase, bacterial
VICAGLQPIPGHRLTQRLGAGAFGEVWEATNPDGRLVALKFIDGRSKSSTMLRGEIRVLQGLRELRHPNIIELFGVSAYRNYLVLSMERADGSLADLHQTYVEETGRDVPPEDALDYLGQVAEALDFLAEVKLPGFASTSHGLQHCDVKPTNLLVMGDRVKVADFGLCVGTSIRTHVNGWRGTVPYAAPELFHGHSSNRTDQYALAVTYCELCYNNRPFRPFDLKNPQFAGLPIDLDKVPEREVTILAKALHAQPLARYPSCGALIAALRRALLDSEQRACVAK